MIDGDDCGANTGMNEGQGKQMYTKETCLSAALSTTDPTCFHPGPNPGRRDGKSTNNFWSYGTFSIPLLLINVSGNRCDVP
jgi:hypothetical protein